MRHLLGAAVSLIPNSCALEPTASVLQMLQLLLHWFSYKNDVQTVAESLLLAGQYCVVGLAPLGHTVEGSPHPQCSWLLHQ
eukprot:366527-Chlamydomonas_euryale.AAC.7